MWPVGAWPYPKSLARAARWDGVIVSDRTGGEDQELTATAVAEVVKWMADHRPSMDGFDVITEGVTSGSDRAADRAQLQPLAEAGATWFIESRWEDDQSARHPAGTYSPGAAQALAAPNRCSRCSPA